MSADRGFRVTLVEGDGLYGWRRACLAGRPIVADAWLRAWDEGALLRALPERDAAQRAGRLPARPDLLLPYAAGLGALWGRGAVQVLVGPRHTTVVHQVAGRIVSAWCLPCAASIHTCPITSRRGAMIWWGLCCAFGHAHAVPERAAGGEAA